MPQRSLKPIEKGDAGFKPHLLLEELASANAELERFAHLCSHDLKEPLRGLSFLALTLVEDYAAELPEEAKARLARMQKLCCRLQARITDLLYYACISTQDMVMVDVSAGAIVEEAIEELFDTLTQNHAQVNVSGELPVLHCNRSLVLTVFLNLITNAVRFNDRAEKKVEIRCVKSLEHEGRTWRNVFCVSDNGIGIDQRYHAEVFNIFKRGHTDKAYGECNGAGLTFVQRIIERHGGATWLASIPGQGSQVYFTLEPAIA